MNQGSVDAFLEIRKKGKEQKDKKEEEKKVFGKQQDYLK
jgi:hypothetical protein